MGPKAKPTPPLEAWLQWIAFELVRRRKKEGWSQEALSAAIGLSRNTISVVEQVPEDIQLSTLHKIAAGFHESVPQFMKSPIPKRFLRSRDEGLHIQLQLVLDSESEDEISLVTSAIRAAARLALDSDPDKER